LLDPTSDEDELGRAPTTLAGAVGTILIADLVMSLDNVLGVAAAAKGDVPLLIFALIVSMALLMLAGGLIANLLDRFWWLAYVGAAIIAWTGAEMLQDDSLIQQWVATPDLMRWIVDVLVTAGVILVARRIHHHAPRPEPVTARSERISE
jgi:predicted tellurium resistance membrane protein TerC